MSREEFAKELAELAASLESDLAHTKTRDEHIRVSRHAAQAKRLAQVFNDAASSAA